MAAVIKIKSSSVSGKQPNTTNISTSELALNITDGIMYSTNGSTVFEIGANTTSLQAGSLVYPTSDSTSGHAITTNGSGTLSLTEVIGSNTLTTTATTEVALDTFPHATYRAAKYVITAVQGTNIHSSEALLLHNTSSASVTEYGTIIFGTSQYTINADINGADARLLVTPASTSSTTFKIKRILVEV